MTSQFDTGTYGVMDQKTGKPILVGTKEECEDNINAMKARATIREKYEDIKHCIEKYIDMKDNYYTLIAIWTIGTYFHNQFPSFPYLYFNAMKGSGKTRTIKLITALSKDGEIMASPTEATLFRTNGTLGIDEFEAVGKKDKGSIRELLNASYKKGITVMRMKKKKTSDGEEQVVEKFDPYRPIVIANIWGMEDVLGDRCIKLVLERSNDNIKTRLVEDFDSEIFTNIRNSLNKCSLCGVVTKKNIYKEWNNYIIDRHKTTLHTYTSFNKLHTDTTFDLIKNIEFEKIFNKIHDTGIKGRNLELFMPLFIIADIISNDILNELLEIAKEFTGKKQHEDEMESIDISLMDFISKQSPDLIFHSIKELTEQFKLFVDENEEWLNRKWFGRALKRLDLIVDKRRVSRGMEVILNVKKAKEKILMFKEEENVNSNSS